MDRGRCRDGSHTLPILVRVGSVLAVLYWGVSLGADALLVASIVVIVCIPGLAKGVE